LEAGQKPLIAFGFFLDELIDTLFFPREKPGDIFFHFPQVGADIQVKLRKIELVHGVQLHSLQIVLGAASHCGKHLIQDEFHHQKSGTGIKLEVPKFNASISAPHTLCLFQNLDLITVVLQKHPGGQSSRTCANYQHFFLLCHLDLLR
jgi:hypothetical protein